MANVLHGLSKKYEQLPATVLDNVITEFTRIAEKHGGRIRRYQLTAEPRNRGIQGNTASVLMIGTPAGFWVWKETGIGAHTISRKRARFLAGDLSHPLLGPVLHPGVPGKRAWSATVEEVEQRVRALTVSANDKVAA